MTETETPTQVRRPWRATVRTAFAVIIALAAMLPLLVDAAGLDETLPPVAAALAIASAITRIMALPAVEHFLQRFLPFLAAEPGATTTVDDRGESTVATIVGVTFSLVIAVVAAALLLALLLRSIL